MAKTRMTFTDDNPEILREISVIGGRNKGPVGISNHTEYGFNIRHFGFSWQDNSFYATRQGIAIAPEDLHKLVTAIANFARENNIVDMEVTINDSN